MRFSITTLVAASVLLVGLFGRPAGAGTVLTLSDLSSDETNAEELDAMLLFSVFGDELTLAVTNDTPVVGGFDIDAVYFNATSDITGLQLIPPVPGWTLFPDESADGFGTFDFAVISDLGNDAGEIASGDSLIFTFEVTASGPFAETDFTTEFSEVPPGDNPALAAAKFVNGTSDDSAFGAVIPEPGSALFAMIGVGAVAWIKRRTK